MTFPSLCSVVHKSSTTSISETLKERWLTIHLRLLTTLSTNTTALRSVEN